MSSSESAESVLAKRLADGKKVVLVVEAEKKSSLVAHTRRVLTFDRPSRCQFVLYFGTRRGHAGQRRFFVPRGKLIGGTSAINGMIVTRG